jgi:LPXTG-motif cell wall-anchored protein
MTKTTTLILTVATIFLVAAAFFNDSQWVNAQTDPASSKLQAAIETVDQAFNAISDAERAGANVTDLLVQINAAQGLLAEAENAFRTGDSNAAANLADSVFPIAQSVVVTAQDAKQDALNSNQTNVISTIVLTVVGVIVFVLVLLFVWRRFKQNYINKLLKTKPEVVSDET